MQPKKTYDPRIWAELKQKLPWELNNTDKALRIQQWRQLDVNGNGFLSLAELDKGMQYVIKLPTLFKVKPVMLRAFNAAKDKVKSKSELGDDYIEKKEHRYLLKYLR
jgi:hypothetical protein